MAKLLTQLQIDILRIAQTRNLADMTYRELALYVGVSHPYSVQQAINRLLDKGALIKNQTTGEIFTPNLSNGTARPFLNIPIFGKVSCGPAVEMAEDYTGKFLSISPSIANIRRPELTYALIACGDSMSSARVNGKTVDDGDYVITEKRTWGDAKDGDYVISRFNDMNNLKKLRIDMMYRRFILLSESLEDHPPIFIAEEDMEYYAIEGIAIDIVKGLPT